MPLPRAPLLPPLARTSHQILNHRHQPHLHAVVGVIDTLDAVGMEFGNFLGRDGAAAAAKDTDVAGTALAQHVDHVLEVLHVAALVTGQGDAIGVFLQRGADHVFDRAIVSEMDHFGALTLNQPAHDVDRGVMAIEQAGCSDEAQRSLFAGARTGGQLLVGGRAHAGSGIWRSEPPILARACMHCLPT